MLDADGEFDSLSEPARAARIAEFAARLRINTYDTETGQISISQERAQAIAAIITHYQALFGGSGDGPEAEAMREAFAIPNAPLGPDPDEDIRALVSWWWWTSWAAATLRPDDTVTYTNNWPHEPLVGNKPTSSIFIWTFVSIVLLIAGIGALCWFFLREREEWQKDTEPPPGYPDKSPIATVEPTASMRGVVKYIWIVAVLLGLQILLGAVTAHYAVEGHEFYGIPLAEIAPYALTRTWHVQLAVLWIATAWLGGGPVSRSHDRRVGTALAEAGRGCALGGAGDCSTGFAGRRMAGLDRAHDGPGHGVLVRPPGLRIPGYGAFLADPDLCRPAYLAGTDGALSCACNPRKRRRQTPAHSPVDFLGRESVSCSAPDFSMSGTPTLPLPSTGAGGSCISGSKACLKYSQLPG